MEKLIDLISNQLLRMDNFQINLRLSFLSSICEIQSIIYYYETERGGGRLMTSRTPVRA